MFANLSLSYLSSLMLHICLSTLVSENKVEVVSERRPQCYSSKTSFSWDAMGYECLIIIDLLYVPSDYHKFIRMSFAIDIKVCKEQPLWFD